MKRKITFLAICACLLLAPLTALGGDVPPDLAASLQKAGVPIYPGSVFCMGATDTGIRFATKDNPETVRQWYRDQRPAWSLFEQASYGIWVLYEGPKKIGMMEWTKYNMGQVGTNPQIPAWHSLPGDMTTEIILGVADQFK